MRLSQFIQADEGLVKRLEQAVATYVGQKPKYRTLKVLGEEEWKKEVGEDSALFGGTAAIRTDEGDIFIREGFEGDALHELVHAAGILLESGQTETVMEGINQAATEEIAKKVGVKVRKTYPHEVEFVRKYLLPVMGVTLQELVKGYAKAAHKVDYLVDRIWERAADHFSDVEEWGRNPKQNLKDSLKRQVGAHNDYLKYLVDERSMRLSQSQFVRLAADPLITVPYLQKLREVAEGPEFYQARIELDKLIRHLKNEYSGVEPFPVTKLWTYLSERDVPADEIALLQKTKGPRAPKAKPQVDPHQLMSMIGTASGKPLLYGLPDDWKFTKPADVELMTKNAKMWVKAFENLKRYHVAEKVHQRLTHKMLVGVKGHGTEEASWKSSNVMAIYLSRPIFRVSMAIEIVVHELGHAFEEMFELSELITVYGPEHLPCITDYAKRNVWEDFAETFMYYSLHPSELKSKVPAKYADMARRIKEKLG